ncbi:MAG: T9SS type A sorting domain-containing protein [Bacteroidetes bacterium]|nr:T9SS type A sorting domain-containing protein [Bacteroidota bacterium]
MRRLIISLILVLLIFDCKSQVFDYQYDSTGNRIESRMLMVQPLLSVNPKVFNYKHSANSGSITLKNYGQNELYWQASTTANWITNITPDKDTNNAQIVFQVIENKDTFPRNDSIIITTQSGVLNSPVTVYILQAAMPVPDKNDTVITPKDTFTAALRTSKKIVNVSYPLGVDSFYVSNSGNDTLFWTAKSKSNWLDVLVPNNGIDSGWVKVSYKENTSIDSRSGIIELTADDTRNSPYNVVFVQEGKTSSIQDIRQSIVIYPNPAEQLLSIKSDAKVNQYSILDLQGHLIAIGHNIDGTINVEQLASGQYLLKLVDEQNRLHMFTFIKK